MSVHKYTNKLIHETSPYLLQHAHNPVDWFPWSDEALQKAITEDKPILVSIGYSACHWCHVMERESFEDEATADIMNEHFINIKIDREERPDLDHIYMDAVQAMSGNGGWPLNVFLTPDARPFYGGTYFPPVKAFNRMSWKETLAAVNNAWQQRREEIISQAENLTTHIINSNNFGLHANGTMPDKTMLQTIADNLLQAADKQWGGFGKAPKFPQTFSIQYLLRHYYSHKFEPGLTQALLSLDKMIDGGIYDQLGGGFARYSTDAQWLAPHFEKMLYDNALLISVMAEAHQLTKQKRYAIAITETVDFLEREMMLPGGGFYAALDADSEGVEGKYYVWSKKEIDEILSEDASNIFCAVFDVSEKGNWEGENILWRPNAGVLSKLNTGEQALQNILADSKQKLLAARNKRIRPGTDDKILLGWNALMVTALCKAAIALDDEKIRSLAVSSMLFLEKNFKTEEGEWMHNWKNGHAKHHAFLDDHAYLTDAYLHLYELTNDLQYLSNAKSTATFVVDNFSDEDNLFFYFTSLKQQDVIVRKKEMYDGATPSGNAIMANNLFRLSLIYDIPVWRTRSENMIKAVLSVTTKYPTSFGCWAGLLQLMLNGVDEIAVIGQEFALWRNKILQEYLPFKILQATLKPDKSFPLLNKNDVEDGLKTEIYKCKNYACDLPYLSVDEFLKSF
jgi:uncharacterized protein YyaL (SSP411 family)